ncbi:glycosyltransferase family 4 protein [Mucilaginibacter sp. L3T2-6]|uniref:glycosyltransferase family 4 protein n=1 Tax=Mucilaginibacter sp. L3T2-6 TaxID=3062491 RepID=UPI002675235D|nr:glycosyltransferase family 4 protein [Mucilaginibacter sp. L3T2-6]MDO3644660.1 glycosyltransferase family 4 protein [Mucilaginibacter sp. L3T2-6]MDV6217112.1 glycosyltransferase family 4 protein [Mucilaginibacter sp. L3T2-6]
MKIAYISTYPPRECGIATFNCNLMRAVNANFPERKSLLNGGFVVALNDSENMQEYEYPEEVKYIIRQNHQKDYIRAANYINTSNADVCIMEHEFGIYGGESGIYILPLINRLEKPLISILHTILKDPSYVQRIIIREIAEQSSKIVVMSKRAVEFLTTIYDVPEEKIVIIEHGVPDVEASKPNPVKSLSQFKNRKVMLTFGLISRGKGLETVVRALPKIARIHPEIMYVVLGNTHPGVIKSSGEEYRDHLKTLAAQLNVSSHLSFINKFVTEEELVDYLAATDIYVTPYLNEAQITSGTLSYAVGAGAAVVSTPYWHATELLADNRGRLFDFKDADALAEIVIELLNQERVLNELKENAYDYGLHLRWPVIGAEYIRVAHESCATHDFSDRILKNSIVDPEIMPKFSLNHVLRLTDDTGIVQHAKYGIPNLKEGYCLDDNARALIMALMAYQRSKSREAFELLPIYLSYIHYMQTEDGNFRNFLSFDRRYLDDVGSEDSFGRTIWSLGYLIGCSSNNSYKEFATELFHKSFPHFKTLKHLRGMANTIIGISLYLQAVPGDEGMVSEMINLTQPLIDAYDRHQTEDWQWFEEKMTYDNAILPLALLHSCHITGNEKVKQTALKTMAFLDEVTLSKGYLSPVGNDGWYSKGKNFPVYDQQAIETMAMVLMHFQAYTNFRKPQYIEKMFLCYKWFLGENSLRAPLYDHETKGCCDGLLPGGINRNQGAESTLAYLISHLTVLKAFELEYEYNKAGQSVSLSF